MGKLDGKPELRLYFNDDGPVMAGFLIAVTANDGDAARPSFEEGRILDEYWYEPVTLTLGEGERLGESDMIWVILDGWRTDLTRWEEFEPGGLGAALTKEGAQRLIDSWPLTGDCVIIGFKNGWRYGFDPAPNLGGLHDDPGSVYLVDGVRYSRPAVDQ